MLSAPQALGLRQFHVGIDLTFEACHEGIPRVRRACSWICSTGPRQVSRSSAIQAPNASRCHASASKIVRDLATSSWRGYPSTPSGKATLCQHRRSAAHAVGQVMRPNQEVVAFRAMILDQQ